MQGSGSIFRSLPVLPDPPKLADRLPQTTFVCDIFKIYPAMSDMERRKK